jgi:8-oxo-dGTP diphosphatase
LVSRFIEKEKVLVYVTRTKNAERLLLIFAHRDYPEAGWQVPGGTLEIGEDPGTGALREIEEEAGLTGFLRVDTARAINLPGYGEE